MTDINLAAFYNLHPVRLTICGDPLPRHFSNFRAAQGSLPYPSCSAGWRIDRRKSEGGWEVLETSADWVGWTWCRTGEEVIA